MRNTRVLIIGQGLAGTLLAWYCEQHHIDFLCIDDEKQNTSSRIAAGIVHPVTGRRLVVAPSFSEQMKTATEVYASLESALGQAFFRQKPIIEIYSSVKSKNDWNERSSAPEVAALIVKELAANEIAGLQMPYGATALKGSFLHVSELVNHYRLKLAKQKLLISERFDFSQLKISKHVEYKDIQAERIFYCEGAQAIQNPLFPNLPFQLCKGEMLTIETHLAIDAIINRDMYILPLGNGIWKAGSNYQWNYTDDLPSKEIKESLYGKLQNILAGEFKIVNHQAAIRPTVRDRKTLALQHPTYANVFLINGLGTKGVINAPSLIWKFCKDSLGLAK